MSKKESNEMYRCEICNRDCATLGLYKSHMHVHEDKQFACEFCHWKFTFKEALMKHMTRQHIRKYQYECDICGKKYLTPYYLRMHKRKHNGQFDCKECEKKFTTETALNRHTQIEHDGLRWICFPCNKLFKSEAYLKEHFNGHNPNPTKIKCTECSLTFNTRNLYRSHRRTHKKETAICDVCGKSLSSQTTLKSHKLQHTNERPFVCEICGKGFRKNDNLIAHYRVHTKEKPFSCKECGKCFTQHTPLRVHERLHTGERPYKCIICGQGFITKHLLKVHSAKLHGISAIEISQQAEKAKMEEEQTNDTF